MEQKQQHPNSASSSMRNILTSVVGRPCSLHHSSSSTTAQNLHVSKPFQEKPEKRTLDVLKSDSCVNVSAGYGARDVHADTNSGVLGRSHSVVLGELVCEANEHQRVILHQARNARTNLDFSKLSDVADTLSTEALEVGGDS